MHILLTNDDGYRAEGLKALVRELTKNGIKVTIAAPDEERSAVSHAISILKPLRAKPIAFEGAGGWAIDGTPADCARLGLHLTKDDKPDLCISGINHGSNLGGACIYSGTVNAAMEASMAGCPAIAVSLEKGEKYDFAPAARLAVKLISYALGHPLKRGQVYNLNLPNTSEIKGLYFTQTLAPEFLSDANYQEFTTHYGVKYYFLDDGENREYFPPESDAVKCREGMATLSVVGWDIAVRDDELPQNGEITL